MKNLTILCVAIAISGCAATTYRPIVDMKDVKRLTYETDLIECKEYAERVNPYSEGALGAVTGTVVGLTTFGVAKGLGLAGGATIAHAGGIGATAGAAYGGAKGVWSQYDVVDNCLVGRGYKLLKAGSPLR